MKHDTNAGTLQIGTRFRPLPYDSDHPDWYTVKNLSWRGGGTRVEVECFDRFGTWRYDFHRSRKIEVET